MFPLEIRVFYRAAKLSVKLARFSYVSVGFMGGFFVLTAGDPHAELRGPEAFLQGFGQGVQVHAGEKLYYWYYLNTRTAVILECLKYCQWYYC